MARPIIRKRAAFKQSPEDSLMESLDKELDKRGYTGAPNVKRKPVNKPLPKKKPDYSKYA